MRLPQGFSILACDYDGTLATDGKVPKPVFVSLSALRETGCKLALITGRHLGDLKEVCPDFSAFDVIVAENGAVVFLPGQDSLQVLASPPPAEFVEALRRRKVSPLEVGDVIVASKREHLRTLREVIHELGIEWHLVLNKDAVMALPRGVDKASGLRQILRDLGIAGAEVVGVGDAENDEPFLRICGLAVAVSNALPRVKRRCDYVTLQPSSEGVVELVERLLQSVEMAPSSSRKSAIRSGGAQRRQLTLRRGPRRS